MIILGGMEPIDVIINASSGRDSASPAHQLAELFGGHGFSARIHEARSGDELIGFARTAAEGDAAIVVAGGGDGTVNAVASAVLATDKTLGVLPLGTLNHFARDLQISADLETAVATIAARHTIKADVGEVNGRIFLNNSSLGLYPEMVRGREARQRLGYGKWNALLRSALVVFRRYPLVGVRMRSDQGELVTRTPFAFIGNNAYQIESFSIGARTRLDGGRLSVYMTRRSGRLALLRIALKALVGGLTQEKDFISASTTELEVDTRRPRVRVALDGEVEMMETPLHYKVRPTALRVIVPRGALDEAAPGGDER
jgi:diacylglycerol kinase family enzyme